MHGLADVVVATERERQIAHAAAYMGTGEVLPDPACGPYEVYGIVIMLLHACSNGKDIGVEDNVERVHAYPACKNVICTTGYGYTPIVGGSLSLLVEAHHDDSSSMTHYIPRMGDKGLLALLQGYGVYDTLSLSTLQASHYDLPLAGVYHYGHLGNLRLRGYHIEECHHLSLGIEQSVVHVDVDDHCSILHLPARDVESLLVAFLAYKPQELP